MSEKKLMDFAERNNVDVKFVMFEKPVRTIKESSEALKKPTSSFIKSIVFHENEKRYIAIVLGNDRVNYDKLTDVMGVRAEIAKPHEVADKIGFPAGGVPPFGFSATFVIDSKVMNKSFVYGGGGSHNCLVKINPKEILKVTNAVVEDITD